MSASPLQEMVPMVDGFSESEPGAQARRERRSRALDAAVAAASQGGYDGVQMRSVAEAAGLAVGTLYKYFPCKAHMLVSALARELEGIGDKVNRATIDAETPNQRVHQLISMLDRAMQDNPLVAEAMTRALVFADASAASEVDYVAQLMDRMFAHAMSDDEPSENHYQIARVISDVWLANLLAWLTRRATATEISKRLTLALQLLLGDDEHP